MLDYNLSFEICGMIIFGVIFVIHVSRKKIPLVRNSLFTVILVLGIISSMYTVLDTCITLHGSFLPYYLCYASFMIYFLLLVSVPYVYSLYTLSLTDDKLFHTSNLLRFFVMAPLIFYCFLVFTNYWTGVFFVYGGDRVYHQGKLQIIAYLVCFYYALFGTVYVNHFRKSLNSRLVAALYSFSMIGILTAIVQFLLPAQLVQHFGMSICTMMIFFTIQKPEECLDPTYKVFNRPTFSKMFNINRMRKRRTTLLVLFIEDMKLLNSTVGLEKMNSILNIISEFLDKISNHRAFYLNSSTFCMMLDRINPYDLENLKTAIFKRFDEKFEYENASIYLSIRLMDIRAPEEADKIDEFYSYVDYLKEKPASDVSDFSAAEITLEPLNRRIDVENAIKRGIENQSFMMYYQPIYSIKEKKIVSAEALIRLHDPVLGFIPPDEFIRIAEQTGSILQIGDIVFEKVFSFMEESNIHQYGIDYVEINLSIVQCMQDSLSTSLLESMEKHNIHTSRINLEITETAAVNSPKLLLKNMFNLFNKGVTFSLDDFGTGFSNINSLIELPLSMIKFDKSMIDMATSSDKGKIIIGSSVAMVKKMDMKIVGEGIETVEQQAIFEEMGFDYLQGYLFSKPIPGEQFIEFLKNFNMKR